MIISLLIKRISIFSLSKDFFIIAKKIEGIIKVFNIILSISFRSIFGLTNNIFNCMTFIFLYYLFVKQAVYLKKFSSISIIVYKYGRRHIKTGVIKRVIDWAWHQLWLSHQKYKIYSLITQYIQLICKLAHLFKNLKQINVLLDKLFHNSDR